MPRPRIRSVLRATAVVTATALAALIVPATSGGAATSTVKPVVAGSRYLALGDSVVFGYREPTNLPTPDYSKPASFRGYPEMLARTLGLRLTNAGCPGETAASFLDATAQSNGCENVYDAASGSSAPVGYRTLHPLHVDYTGSQLHFAKRFLRKHPGTRLVSLTIGANDGFLCQKTTTDGCLGEIDTFRATLQQRVAHIFRALRHTGYAGQIALVDYYSFDYSNALVNAETQIINSALAAAAAPYRVTVVSGFDAFQEATVQNGGDTCAAQLITVLTDGGCGVHPSVSGASVLAQAVAAKLQK